MACLDPVSNLWVKAPKIEWQKLQKFGNKIILFDISCKLLTRNSIYKKKCFQVQHLQDKSLNICGKRTWKSVTFEKMCCMVISNLVISLVQKKISVKHILTAFAIHHSIVTILKYVGWNLSFFFQIMKILMFAYHTNFWIFRDKM